MSELPEFPDSGNLRAETGDGVCDFCPQRGDTEWVYPCKDFRYPDGLNDVYLAAYGRDGMSAGGWGACATCAALIEKRHYDKLARRGALNPWQHQIIGLFVQNRYGERFRPDNITSIKYDQPIVYPE